MDRGCRILWAEIIVAFKDGARAQESDDEESESEVITEVRSQGAKATSEKQLAMAIVSISLDEG